MASTSPDQLKQLTAGLKSIFQSQPRQQELDMNAIDLESGAEVDPQEGEYVDTPYGRVLVTIQGDKSKPALLTYHDVGLNHITAFGSFLADQSMSSIVAQFCWYHVDAPGQEKNAARLPFGDTYPTMTQLAEQIEYIADQFQLSYFIGLGIGAGANILARYATINPDRVWGLVLIDLNPSSMSWTNLSRLTGEAVSWQLKGRSEGLTHLATHYLVRQMFGPSSEDVDSDLVRAYTEYTEEQNPQNLSLLLDSYHSRSSISADFSRHVRCDCLFVVSSNFDHKEKVVMLCSSMNNQKATLLEVSNSSGLLLDDHPGKIATALRLFVQGLGLAPSLSSPTLSTPLLGTKKDFSLHVQGYPAPVHVAVKEH